MTKYIIANWKANKTEKETESWMCEMTTFDFKRLTDTEIVVCLPFVFLELAKRQILANKLPIKLGAQNVSHFQEGPYTGAITGKMLKDLVSFVMIGHSERRSLLKETNQQVQAKLKICLEHNLRPIICVSDMEQVDFLKNDLKDPRFIDYGLFLYEPVNAVGSGKAAVLEETLVIINKIKQTIEGIPVLYGGSVTADNVLTYLRNENIDGVAVGGASLDSGSFLNLLNNAAKT